MYQTFFKNARNTQNPGPLTVRLVRGISQLFSFLPIPGEKKTSLRSLVDPRMTKISSPDFQLPGYGERHLLTVPQLIRRNDSFGSFLPNFLIKVTQFCRFVLNSNSLFDLFPSFGRIVSSQNVRARVESLDDSCVNSTPGSLSRGFFLRLMPGRQEYVTG